ncbi:MAG: glucuronate isomerase, partial [Bdellovibrionales bacterium]|nr:glucuronate isomerase [Bdellovibrionales bacterium]
MENLPIVDFHTHYDVSQVMQNKPWTHPIQAFLGRPASMLGPSDTNYGFDHYVAQLMMDQGVREELVYGKIDLESPTPEQDRQFDDERFEAMIGALAKAPGSEVTLWTKIALERVFQVTLPLTLENATAIREAVQLQIEKPEFRPQEILEAGNVHYALTTDDPTSDLSHHGQPTKGPRLLPTWRPDAVLIMEVQGELGRYNFVQWIEKLGKTTNREIASLDQLENALEDRLNYFVENGCIASDIGIPNFVAEPCTRQEAAEIFGRYMKCKNYTAEEHKS